MAKKPVKSTVDEAFFDVSKKPVFVSDEEGHYFPIKNKMAVVKDDGTVLSVLSDRYKTVSNKQVMQSFAEIANKAGIEWTRGKTEFVGNGRKTFMEINFPGMKMEVGKLTNGKADIVDITGHLYNSFDGFTVAGLSMGGVRLICTNGMKAYQTDFSIGYRHVGEVNTKLVDKFQSYVNDSMDDTKNYIKSLTQSAFKDPGQVTDVFEQSKWVPEKYQKDLQVEWVKDGKALGWWVVYNVFTYVITHNMKVNVEGRMALLRKLNVDVEKVWKNLK